MPKLEPLVLTLTDDPERTETYNPTLFSGTEATLVDSSPEMEFDFRSIKSTVRPAGPGNSGRVTEHLGVRPIPLSGDGACCVDVTKPEGNTFRIATMIRKTSSKAQAKDLVLMIRAYVASDEFEQLVTESGYY